MKKTGEEIICRAKIFDVANVHLENKSGEKVLHSVIRFVDTVSVLPITNRGTIILEKQYRSTVDDYLIEIPAGKIDAGETPEEALRRELEEEICMRPLSLRHVFTAFVSCGILDEKMYYYIAEVEEIPACERNHFPDDDETIEIIELTPEEVLKKIYNYEIKDTKTVALLMTYLYEKSNAAKL